MLVVRHPYNLGSAHSGLGEWLVQRISALYISGFVLYLVAWFSVFPVHSYHDWLQWFGSGVLRSAFGVFVLSLLAHAWVGMRSVYMDYLKPMWLRFLVSSITAVGLLVLLLWVTRILLETRIP